MPRGDRTGPNGAGSMTGRGAGLCNGNQAPGFSSSGTGLGRGTGSGRGMGQGVGQQGMGQGMGQGVGGRGMGANRGFKRNNLGGYNPATDNATNPALQQQMGQMQQQLNSITDTIKQFINKK